MTAETRALALLDTVLAAAVESVWLERPMPRSQVAVWHYDEDRLVLAAGGEQVAALETLRDVLSAARDSVTFSRAMDGEDVDRWRAEVSDMRLVAGLLDA